LVSLNRIGTEFKPDVGEPFSATLLNTIIKTLPTIRETVQDFLQAVSVKAAKDNNEAGLWTDPEKYPDIQDAKDVSVTSLKCPDRSASTYVRASWQTT
jgi:DNA mismatch repair protein MSH3